METGNGLIQRLGRISLEETLKPAESPSGGGKQLGGLCRLITDGALHKGVGPPGAAVRIGVVISAFPGSEEAERSAPGVSADLLQLPGEIFGDAHYVFHQLIGPLEGYRTDALENKAAAGLSLHQVSIVNVSLPKPLGARYGGAKFKGGKGVVQISVRVRHGDVSHSSVEIKARFSASHHIIRAFSWFCN